MSRQRIAFVLTQDRGGPVDVAVTLAHSLQQSGEVEVRLFGPAPARGAELVEDILEPLTVSTKGSVGAMRAARRAILAWAPDLVHAQDRRSGLLCARLGLTARRRHRPPVVHTYHGVPDDVTQEWLVHRAGPRPSAYTLATLAADAAVARQVARTVVPSPMMGRFLTRRLQVPKRRVIHIDNGLVLPPMSPPTTVRNLLCVAMLIERKGVQDLLEALASGTRRGLPGLADLTLTVAGDGPLRAQLVTAAERLGLADRVSFLGFRADVPDLLAAADAFVLASRMEQQPLVLIEAMGAGKLVLATDAGGVGDMVAGVGDGACVVAPRDVEALAAGLSALAGSPEPAVAGRLVAEHARRRFSVEATTAAHRQLYDELAKPG